MESSPPPPPAYIGHVTRSQTGSLPVKATSNQTGSTTAVQSPKPRKRRRTSKKGTETSSTNQSLFPLMELPTEIRLQILKSLLWQQAPIRVKQVRTVKNGLMAVKGKNYGFAPQVLRTCRQLKQEGEPVFHDNTLQISAWAGPYVTRGYAVLGKVYKVFGNLFPFHLVQKFTKVHVEYCIWNYDSELNANPITFAESHTHREGLLHLCDKLQDVSQLRELSIHIKKGFRTFAPDNNIKEKFLQTFGLLRKLERVTFAGVSNEFAAQLTTLMTSKTKPEKIFLMAKCLEDCVDYYAFRQYDYTDDLLVLLDKAQDFKENYNVEGFIRARKQIIQDMIKPICDRLMVGGETIRDIFDIVEAEAENS